MKLALILVQAVAYHHKYHDQKQKATAYRLLVMFVFVDNF